MMREIVAPGFIRKACGAVSQTRLNSADSVQNDSVVGCGASRLLDPPPRSMPNDPYLSAIQG